MGVGINVHPHLVVTDVEGLRAGDWRHFKDMSP